MELNKMSHAQRGGLVDNVMDYEITNSREWMSYDDDESETSSRSGSGSTNPPITKPEAPQATQSFQESKLIDDEVVEDVRENLVGPKDLLNKNVENGPSQVEPPVGFPGLSTNGRVVSNGLKTEQPKTEQLKIANVHGYSTLARVDAPTITHGSSDLLQTPQNQGRVSNPTQNILASSVGRPRYQAPQNSSVRSYHKKSSKNQQKKGPEWAGPPVLVKAKEAAAKMEKEINEKYRAQYLSPLDKSISVAGVGYYLWSESTDAPALLGPCLEDLNQIRLTYHVFIELDDKRRSLEISSLSTSRATSDIVNAIKAIRQAILTSKVAYQRSAPNYIVVPPPSKLYRETVEPIFVEGSSTTIKELRLCGEELARHEITKYDSKRDKQLKDNVQLLKSHLIKNLSTLSPLRTWMRMRVNFGHLKLLNSTKGLHEKKFNVDNVRTMMSSNRFRGQFDKKIGDAEVAMTAIKNILEQDKIFSLIELSEGGVKEYKSRHTEVIFIKTPDGQRRRVEAEVDIVDDWSGINAKDKPEEKKIKLGFQIGGIKLFHDDKRNKLLETTAFDFQHELHWNLDVVTDSSIAEIPSAVYALVESSVSTNTEARRDKMNLIYPAVSPVESFGSGIQVEAVVLKTVSAFPLKDSSYIVEVTIYRKWPGCKTQPEPETSCAISMRNSRWDSAMESVENSLQERDWQPNLEDFFPAGPGGDGFNDLVDQIERIRDILTAKS